MSTFTRSEPESSPQVTFRLYGHRAIFSHVPQLDGIRAIAVLLVFFAHCGLSAFVPGGNGVTIFFFLSGYLITSLMVVEFNNTSSISIKNFYIRRVYRILPPLYLSMIFAFILATIVGTAGDLEVKAIIAQALMVSNYVFFKDHASLSIPLWSLAVEEHYYLVFPIVFSTFIRFMTKRKLAFIFAALCFLALIFRLYYSLFTPFSYYTYFWTHTRFDSILFGCILALWANPQLDSECRQPNLLSVVIAIAVMIGCIAIRNQLFRDTFRYTLQGGALLVLFSYSLSAHNVFGRFLANPALSLIGKYSYSIYLLHLPIIRAVETWWPRAPVIAVILISGIGAFFLSALMYRYVDLHFARLRRKLH